ncbi:MAG TPA: GNAT family N-acetyltransferase [Ornithinibacter sp.]|nr:GNAT family N-acetyltransferase [Ornithinibacter sp.]
MRTCPPGWATDLAVLERSGSVVEDHEDHLVVRTRHNPDFYWGNFVLVTHDGGLDDAGRWVTAFHVAFPEATYVAIGLPRMPEVRHSWVAHRLALELDDVLTTRTVPRLAPLPEGYTVRHLRGRDWARWVARSIAENDRTGEHDPTSFERFAQRQADARRELSRRGIAAWFGAFADGTLVADLGIVRCGTAARYQDVSTDAEHRRHGLASHLLGVAARWAAEGGCDQWVIVTESTSSAGRVYRSLGFAPDTESVQAFRAPSG